MDNRKFNLGNNSVRKRENVGLSRSVIYIHTFPSLSPTFLFVPLQLGSKKKKTILTPYLLHGTESFLRSYALLS